MKAGNLPSPSPVFFSYPYPPASKRRLEQMKQIFSSIKDVVNLHSFIQFLQPSAMLLSTPSAPALCKTLCFKYSLMAVLSAHLWEVQWLQRGLQGLRCCTVGLGKDGIRGEPPRSVLRAHIWFYPMSVETHYGNLCRWLKWSNVGQ